MYEKVKAEHLDGVLAIDPFFVRDLLGATGPIEAGELGQLNGANAADVIMHDSYALDPEIQDEGLAILLRGVFKKLREPNLDGAALVTAFGNSVTTQHLKMYADDATTEDAITDLGASGWLSDSNVQAVWHTSATASKVDYFLNRHLDVNVHLADDGGTEVTTVVTLKNSVPVHDPTVLAGDAFRGDKPGVNRMYLNASLPVGARLTSYSVQGKDKKPFTDKEGDHPVAWDVVSVPAGGSMKISFNYALPAGTAPFSIVLEPQESANSDTYSVTVFTPEGGTVQQKGTLDRPLYIGTANIHT
jgi:hypothetical protein